MPRDAGKNKAKLCCQGLSFQFEELPRHFPRLPGEVWNSSKKLSCMWTQPNPRPCIYLGKHPIFILLYLRLKRIPTPPLHMPCDHALKRPETGAHTYWLTRGYSGHSLTTPQHLTIMRALFHTCALAPSHAHTWGGRHTFTHFRHSPRSLTLVLVTRYTRSPCSTVPSALSFNPSGCWTYTVRRKQREAKISPRALSTMNTAIGFVPCVKSTSNVSHQALQIRLLGHWGVKCLVQFSLLSVSSFK